MLRVLNCDESSLWSDELYTMLTVHPDNSLKDVLILQINDNQPPMYMVILKSFFSLLPYNEYGGKFFSITLSVVSIFAIGVCNCQLFGPQTGLLSAFLLGFSTTQIEHSFEVRFYSLVVFCSVVIFYFFLRKRKNEMAEITWGDTFWFSVFLGFAVLTHYFFVFLLIALGISDVYNLWKSKIKSFSIYLKWLLPYFVSLVVLILWILIVAIYKTQVSTGYWLKQIDIFSFIFYPFGNSAIIFLSLFGVIICSLKFNWFNDRTRIVFFIICFYNLSIFIFSYLKFPICVPRYSLVLSPFLITFLAINLLMLSKKNIFFSAMSLLFVTIFCVESLHYSMGPISMRAKEPWREMAQFILKQRDYRSTPIISFGYMLKDKFTINYYLPKLKIINFGYMDSNVAAMDSFYLIQTNGHDKLCERDSQKLNQFFVVETLRFGFEKYGKGGSVSKFRKINP